MADVPPELAAEVQKLERYHAENPQGRYFVPLANAYRKMGALDQAEGLLREGLRRHPDYLSAHIVLGRCLADRGAVADAVGEFRYVLSVDPQNLIALRSLGEIASEGGRSDEAARWYRELLAVDPMNEDARQALDALESRPATSAAAAPEDDGGWSAGGTLQEEGAADETLAWGSVELDVTVGEEARGVDVPEHEPVADPFGSISFGDLELADAGAGPAPAGEPAEDAPAWSAAEGGGWDPYSGTNVELETPAPGAVDGGDAAAEPAGEEEVVTETIAELYARQGFLDRAAEVYRELIRRRGGDPALEARLREVERQAAGEAPADEPPASEPETTTDDIPLLEWSVAGAEAGGARETGAYAAAPAAGEDAFAGSFEGGFGGVALPSVAEQGEPFLPAAELPESDGGLLDWAPAASEAEEVAAIFAREEALFAPAPEEAAAPYEADQPEDGEEPLVLAAAASELLADVPTAEETAGEEAEAPAGGGAHGFRTVRDYLAGVAAWQPGASAAPAGAVAPAEVAPTTTDEVPEEAPPAAEAFHEAATEDEEDDMPWLAPPLSAEAEPASAPEPLEIDGLLESESAGAAASLGGADEEPFPWELAPAGDEVAPPPAPAEAEAPAASAFSFEEFFVEPAGAPAPPEPQPPAAEAPRAEAAPAQPEQAQAGGGEDDEDLESFQAWLQSLKR